MYVKKMGVRDFDFQFTTQQATDWYDPVKPYTKLEYEWILDNVELGNVMDVGAHHGHYSIILGQGKKLLCVDPFYHNTQLIKKNLELNGLDAQIVYGAVAKEKGQRGFRCVSNGRLDDNSSVMVDTYKLVDLMPEAQVIKIDIEGAEFEILPEQVTEMPKCHTWIVEIHPGEPDVIAQGFLDRGFELLKVNREKMVVEPYKMSSEWKSHATLIARKA